MGTFEEMMKAYQGTHKGTGSSKPQKTYDLKNYFNTMLADNVDEAKKRIRILPSTSGSPEFWTTMYGHVQWVDDGYNKPGYKTFPCLKHEKGEACPFCEARELLLADGGEVEKEEAKKYSPRKFYIVRLIDRDHEEDGVKIWRIKHNFKKEGNFDKIMTAMGNCEHDVTDPQTGRDLLIDLKKITNPKGTAVTIGYPLNASPLSNDSAKSTEWLADTKNWEDVYSLRGYDYLAIIVKGDIPTWDKENNKYVGKSTLAAKEDTTSKGDNLEEEVTFGMEAALEADTAAKTTKAEPEVKSEVKTPKKEAKAPVVVSEDEDEEDMPF